MKYLLSEWGKMRSKIETSHVYFMLDFDGTLADIRRDPEKVVLSENTRDTLLEAVKTDGISVAVISGRSRKDIMTRVGVRGIAYIGNHGFEADIPEFDAVRKKARSCVRVMNSIYSKLKRDCKGLVGVIVENKTFTLSMHYRMASPPDSRKAVTTFKSLTAPYVSAGKIKITSGKKIMEIRPKVEWDKGRAAAIIVSKKNKEKGKDILPIYIGDDITDESAFRAVGKRGITIFVGRPNITSSAEYYLRGIREVAGIVRSAVKIKERKYNGKK